MKEEQRKRLKRKFTEEEKHSTMYKYYIIKKLKFDKETTDIPREIADTYQDLFNLMSNEHNLILTISEMDEIIHETQKIINNINNMAKKMKNLPEGMVPDKDNIVYYDTEKMQFYIIKWEDSGSNDYPVRHYIPK